MLIQGLLLLVTDVVVLLVLLLVLGHYGDGALVIYRDKGCLHVLVDQLEDLLLGQDAHRQVQGVDGGGLVLLVHCHVVQLGRDGDGPGLPGGNDGLWDLVDRDLERLLVMVHRLQGHQGMLGIKVVDFLGNNTRHVVLVIS